MLVLENETRSYKISKGDAVVITKLDSYRVWGVVIDIDASFIYLRFEDGRTRAIPLTSISKIEPDRKVPFGVKA